MQMNAKYVGLSGTKNIAFGLWLMVHGVLSPKAE